MGLQLLYTLASVGIISLLAFVGILTLSINKRVLSRLLILFVSFSAGAPPAIYFILIKLHAFHIRHQFMAFIALHFSSL